MARTRKEEAPQMGEPPTLDEPYISKYSQEREESDDDLPLANLDSMDEQGLLVYGIRNLNIDMAGQTAAQMRDTLSQQIGKHRAGFRG